MQNRITLSKRGSYNDQTERDEMRIDDQIERSKKWALIYFSGDWRGNVPLTLEMKCCIKDNGYLQEILKTIPISSVPSYLLSREAGFKALKPDSYESWTLRKGINRGSSHISYRACA